MNEQHFSVKVDAPNYIKHLTVDKIHIRQSGHTDLLPTSSDVKHPSVLYNNNGYLIYKGSDGTVTVLGNK